MPSPSSEQPIASAAEPSSPEELANHNAHLANIIQLLRWIVLVAPVAILTGSASAFFLWSLELVTRLRWDHAWLLWLLPVGGSAVGALYHFYGKTAEAGSNLVIDEIHQPGGGVPGRMAPLVFVGTLITHLCGGSAGREGTAVQIGGSIAGTYGRIFRVSPTSIRILLMAGIAAGFGSVFGTPLTGAIFAMEVLVIGRVHYDALLPVLFASILGDLTCSAWGIQHTLYHIQIRQTETGQSFWELLLLGKVVLVAILFGLVSQLFSRLTHALKSGFAQLIPHPILRPVAGGLLVVASVYLIGNRDYLGIGVSSPDPHAVTILSSFNIGGAHAWSWGWKLLFTAVTLGSGFKGGEVTPLFFIGATLGNVLAPLIGAPVDLFAGLGFIAVFAGATNTPLACTVMGMELFGAHDTVYFAAACFVAYFFSGKSGIYTAQRLGISKRGSTFWGRLP